MVNLNDDVLAAKVEPALSGMVADMKDARDGVRFAGDLINYVDTDSDEMLDPVEVREHFIRAAHIVGDLYRCVCKYAALARAYEETLSVCGGDIRKLVEPETFAERVRKIRESLKREVMEMTAGVAAKQCGRV